MAYFGIGKVPRQYVGFPVKNLCHLSLELWKGSYSHYSEVLHHAGDHWVEPGKAGKGIGLWSIKIYKVFSGQQYTH